MHWSTTILCGGTPNPKPNTRTASLCSPSTKMHELFDLPTAHRDLSTSAAAAGAASKQRTPGKKAAASAVTQATVPHTIARRTEHDDWMCHTNMHKCPTWREKCRTPKTRTQRLIAHPCLRERCFPPTYVVKSSPLPCPHQWNQLRSSTQARTTPALHA